MVDDLRPCTRWAFQNCSPSTNMNDSSDTNSPDSSNGNQQDGDASVKRKRITQACDACNKKKVKCDGVKPFCSNCTRSSLVICAYSRSAKKRGPRAGYIESLENRLKEMEALLKPLQNDSAVSGARMDSMEGPSDTTSISGESKRRKRKGKRHHESLSGSESEGIESDSGSPAGDGKSNLHPGHPNLYAANGSNQALPPEVGAELVELFFHYVYPVLPLVHKTTFMRTYTDESPLLLNAMYALAARYSNHPAVRTNLTAMSSSGDVFYVHARELVDHYMDVPSSTTVSALLALAMYAAGSGRGSAAWMYSGMAIRMAQELKLNVEPEFEEAYASSGRLSWLEKETRRRLWWCCFVLDRTVKCICPQTKAYGTLSKMLKTNRQELRVLMTVFKLPSSLVPTPLPLVFLSKITWVTLFCSLKFSVKL